MWDQKCFIWVFLSWNFKKTIVVFEISILEFVKYEFLTEDSVTQAQSDETMHLTNIEVAFSNINEMSHVMNKKNRSSDKKTGKS